MILFQKLKLIGSDKFNYLIYILTDTNSLLLGFNFSFEFKLQQEATRFV
jgi:hypothetical protein